MVKCPPIEWIVTSIIVVVVSYYFSRDLIRASMYGPVSIERFGIPIPTEKFYQVERKYFKELEPLFSQILPIMKPIKGLNLTEQYFLESGWDRELHQQCKSKNITPELIKYLDEYERVKKHDKDRADEYPSRILQVIDSIDDNYSWILMAGRLTLKEVFLKTPIMKRYKKIANFTVTGLFYYPPGGYTIWHTNRYDKIGWRVYYVQTEEEGKSWFNYRDNQTGVIYSIPDKSGYFNIFQVKEDFDDALWHCVHSETHRHSVGLYIPDIYAHLVIHRAQQGYA